MNIPKNLNPDLLPMLKQMTREGYCEKTITTYLYGMRRLIKYYKKNPSEISLDEIREYQFHVINRKIDAQTTYRITCCSMRYYYKVIHKPKLDVELIPYPKKEKRIINLLSRDQCYRVIECAPTHRSKSMFMLAYECGLRNSEIRNLKMKDVDRGRMKIIIRKGKGRKDREVPLSPIILNNLIALYKKSEGRMVDLFFWKKFS